MRDEYIRKDVAVDELQFEPIFSDAWNALREARDRIKAIKSADVAPVVFCKDCRKRRKDGYCTKFIQNISGIASAWYMPQDDDFCSYGEREE